MKYAGNRHLSGNFAEVSYNGIRLFTVSKIDIKITVNREDVQVGLDIDTKVTGLKGEGTVTIKRVYSAFSDVRKEILAGKDPRGTITTALKDPDALDGQEERYQINNVALNEFPISYEQGKTVEAEYPFGFTPTDMIALDEITV